MSHKDKKTGEEVLVKDDPRVVDPVLKESAFLTNIFNRLARSCFYGAAKACDARLPGVEASVEVAEECRQATLAFERTVHGLDFHGALAAVEEFCRAANKRWDAASKAAGDDADAYFVAADAWLGGVQKCTFVSFGRWCAHVCGIRAFLYAPAPRLRTYLHV